MTGAPYAIPVYDPSARPGTGNLPFASVTNAAQLIAAINLMNVTGVSGTIYAAAGTYAMPVGAGPTVTQSRVNIIGAGDQASVIVFSPTANDQAAITFDNAGVGGVLAQCSIQGFGFSSADTTYRKIMVSVVDVQQFEMSHIASSQGAWVSAAHDCEGIRSKGRMTLNLHDSSIYTNIPLRLMQDPRFPTLETDHYHFGPCLELGSSNGNPTVKIDAAVVLSNMTFDGVAFVSGGIEWAGSSLTASYHFKIANSRFEQLTAGKWMVDFTGASTLQSFTMDNVRLSTGGVAVNGVRLRHVTQGTLRQVFYEGTASALDIDVTVFNLKGDGVRAANPATVSMTGQNTRWGTPSEEASPLLSPFFESQSTASANGFSSVVNGVKKQIFTGTVANGAQSPSLWATVSGTEKVFLMIAVFKDSVTGREEGGMVIGTGGAGGGISAVSASTNFGVGNVGNKVTLFWTNLASVTVLNQLAAGASVDYMVDMSWY